jgi:hypothetical protein
MDDEYVRIPVCPRCQRPHRYRLAVARSSNGNGAAADAGPAAGAGVATESIVESRRTVRFTRRFICPWTAEGFQVTFPLKESCHARIQDVSVIGTI